MLPQSLHHLLTTHLTSIYRISVMCQALGAQQSTLQKPFIAPHLHGFPSPGRDTDLGQANPNIRQSRIWIRASKGQKEKPGVEKYRREHASGRVACRFRSSEKQTSKQKRLPRRSPGPAKDRGGGGGEGRSSGLWRRSDTREREAGGRPSKESLSPRGKVLRRSPPG